MAKPAFIYAFDNLGPYRFIELCAELLAARYKGFILGGVGADGGIDGEIDNVLGEWYPETKDALLNHVIESGNTVIFQFKHKVTARVGQANARTQLLKLYHGKASEVNKELIVHKTPAVYVLITNVEVNSQFRNDFQNECKKTNPNIGHYQVVGLDELETWVTQAVTIRHLYLPTIFDVPRYNLRLEISLGFVAPVTNYGIGTLLSAGSDLFQITIYNVGTMPSYISGIIFAAIQNGEETFFQLLRGFDDTEIKTINPKIGEPLEPGRKQTFHFRLSAMQKSFGKMFLTQMIVTDEIQNRYSVPIPEEIREKISN